VTSKRNYTQQRLEGSMGRPGDLPPQRSNQIKGEKKTVNYKRGWRINKSSEHEDDDLPVEHSIFTFSISFLNENIIHSIGIRDLGRISVGGFQVIFFPFFLGDRDFRYLFAYAYQMKQRRVFGEVETLEILSFGPFFFFDGSAQDKKTTQLGVFGKVRNEFLLSRVSVKGKCSCSNRIISYIFPPKRVK